MKITETKLRKIIRNLLIENKFKGGSWRAYEMKKKHYQNRKGKDAYEEVDGDSLVYDVSQGRINAEELANKYSKDELISAARDAWHLLQQNHPLIRTERELKRAHGVIEDALAMMGVPEEEARSWMTAEDRRLVSHYGDVSAIQGDPGLTI